MSAILEEHARRLPTWVAVSLGIGIGLGAAAVAIVIALIGVAAALAGNGSLPDVLARLSAS